MLKAILANGLPTQQVSRQTDTPQLAAIYARVSTTEQADKGYSLPTQLEACQTPMSLSMTTRARHSTARSLRSSGTSCGSAWCRPSLYMTWTA